MKSGVVRRLGQIITLSALVLGLLAAPASADHLGGCLDLPGTVGNYGRTPDSTALSITSDIDFRGQVSLDDWTPAGSERTVVSKYTATGNQRSYVFTVQPAGQLRLYLSATGTTASNATSSVATGTTDGTTKWIRATWRQSDGRVQFFLSDNGNLWTQLGTDQTLGVASIFNSTAFLELGSYFEGGQGNWAGGLYQVQVLDGIGGPPALNASFTEKGAHNTQLPSSFVETSANTATISILGSGWFWGCQITGPHCNWEWGGVVESVPASCTVPVDVVGTVDVQGDVNVTGSVTSDATVSGLSEMRDEWILGLGLVLFIGAARVVGEWGRDGR